MQPTVWKGFYYDSQAVNRQTVSVIVLQDGLQIEKEDGTKIWWPYKEIFQTQGFYPGEHVRIEKGKGITEAVVIEDQEFLSALQQNVPSAKAHFFNPAVQKHLLRLTFLATVAAILLGFILYQFGIPSLANAAASRIPLSWEEKLGQSMINTVAPEEKRSKDLKQIKAIEQIASTLITKQASQVAAYEQLASERGVQRQRRFAASQSSFPYSLHIIVLNTSVVNAFALPGGYIVIYRGLLEKVRTPEELAGVLAHEIQHILRRHATKAICRELSMRYLVAILTGDNNGMASMLQAAKGLGALRYSRQDEEEADREGMKMIQRAKIDPSGMINFFVLLSKEDKNLPNGFEYLSTHPLTAHRIEMLRRLKAQQNYTPIHLLSDSAWMDIKEAYFSRTNLINAARNGDIQGVKFFLSHGADVNAKNEFGKTALTTAAQEGYADIVQLLLSRGADVNAKNKYDDRTALMAAALFGHADIAQFLLSHGADVNAKDKQDDTALMAAAWRDHADIVQLLLSHGADVNAKNKYGIAVLMFAASDGYTDIVQLLLSHGADATAKDNNGATALMGAANGGYADIVQLLLSHGADVNAKDKYGNTSLKMAEKNRYPKSIIIQMHRIVNWKRYAKTIRLLKEAGAT